MVGATVRMTGCVHIHPRSILDLVLKTAVCVLTDKEEVGSMGNNWIQSSFLENFIADICALSSDKYTAWY